MIDSFEMAVASGEQERMRESVCERLLIVRQVDAKTNEILIALQIDYSAVLLWTSFAFSLLHLIICLEHGSLGKYHVPIIF